MSEWVGVEFKDVAEFVNGFAFAPSDLGTDGTPVIRIEQINNPTGFFDKTLRDVPTRNHIFPGDTIFSWSGTIKTVRWQSGFGYLNQHLFKVNSKDGVDSEFLRHLIDFNIPVLLNSAHGSTMKHLQKGDIEKHSILLPPLKQQKRIAEILSVVDEQIESIRVGIQKYQKIEAGLTETLVDEPTLSFSDFVLIRPPLTNKPGNEEDAAFLPMECLSENGEITSFHHRKWSDIKQGFTHFQAGDTLVAKITPCFENGKGAYVTEDIRFGAGSTEYHVLRARENVSSRWVYWITRSKKFIILGAGLMEGSAGQQRVPRDFIENFRVSNPTLPDIKKTLKALDANQSLLRDARASENKLLNLKKSLMDDLLTGRTRVRS